MKEDASKPNENTSTDTRKKISKVKVALTLGHSASYRPKVANGEFTHDWSFYVRGDPGCKIYHFIDRVVFKLHDSFENPIQVLKKPPYEIHEQGYGAFVLLVEVNFKNKREPKQIEYKYDLVLPAEGVPPIKHCRKERLTFTNPNSEFMNKLIDGGGVLYHFDTKGNLISGGVPKQSQPIEHAREAKSSQPSTNKNREQPAKSSKEHDERRASKEKKKEIKKDKRALDDEEDEDDSEEEIRAKKKEKKREKHPPVEEDNRKQKIRREEEVPVKEPKKHKKAARPHTSNSISESEKGERKPKLDDRQKPKIASVLAAIGDLESSDDDKYFKNSPVREAPKQSLPSENQSKKTPQKPAQKDKPKKIKSEDTFLEFDNVDALKVKKKSKAKLEKHPLKATEPEQLPRSVNKDEKVKGPKPVKTKRDAKQMKKYSSSNSEEDEKPSKPTVGNSFLEFDDISSLKSKKKSPDKPAIKSEKREKQKKKIKEDAPPPPKDYKPKQSSKYMMELKPEKSRKRSSSLSSDTEDEEDGEIKTPSSDVDIDADEAEVARILNMDEEVKEEALTPKTKHDHKEKKNKHKAIKKEPESPWKPTIKGEIKTEKMSPAARVKNDGTPRYKASPMRPESSKATHSEPSRAAKSYSKPPEFHRAPPDQYPLKRETESPPLSSLRRPIPSPPPPHRRGFSESSSDQETTFRPGQPFPQEAAAAPVPSTEPALLDQEHLRFMLNIYNKIHQLQKTDDKRTMSEVVNILSNHGNSNMVIKDENVTFDLVNCDLETLRSIDSVLS